MPDITYTQTAAVVITGISQQNKYESNVDTTTYFTDEMAGGTEVRSPGIYHFSNVDSCDY